MATNQVYTYKCPKCKYIEHYSRLGLNKCPKCGSTMIRQNDKK